MKTDIETYSTSLNVFTIKINFDVTSTNYVVNITDTVRENLTKNKFRIGESSLISRNHVFR